MRTDPSDNGGLFVGRRPGTAPVHYANPPQRGGDRRQRVDGSFANLLLLGIFVMSALCWGPIPLACLWVAGRVNYVTGSVTLGILVAFICLFGLLFGALAVLRRLDNAWILVRRAAGFDQRTGALGRIFAGTCAICAAVFVFYFVVVHGPGSSTISGGSGI